MPLSQPSSNNYLVVVAPLSFQNFKATMKLALETESSPLDANLESVLPGLHQWHTANNQAIGILDKKVDTFTEKVINRLEYLVEKANNADNYRENTETRLAAVLQVGSDILRNGRELPVGVMELLTAASVSGDASRLTDSPIGDVNGSQLDHQDTVAVTVEEEDNDDDVEEQKHYRMRPKHATLADWYDEWVGAGDFEDGFGGIEGRNKKYGSKWRKHLNVQHYSRTCRVVKAIRAFAEEQRMDTHDACATLQHHYKNTAKCSVGNMVKYVNSMGLLQKGKARGKQMKKQQKQ
jgi:Transcriptional activator of glycolytic enzymes